MDSTELQHSAIVLRHGQAFTVVAYDQNLNSVVANIHSFVRSGKARLSEGQAIQRVDGCKNVTYVYDFLPTTPNSLCRWAL